MVCGTGADTDLVRAAGLGDPHLAVCNDHDIVPAVLTLIAQGAGLLQGIGPHHLAVLGDLHHGAGLAVEGKGDQAGHTRQGDEADEQKPETKGFA